MEHMITISLSLHYVTKYGEELVVNFDNGNTRKMSWGPNHVWTVTLTIPPRSTRWWYSVSTSNQITRVEDLVFPREYDFDSKDRYFEIVDRWNDHFTNVTPIESKKLVSSKSMSSKLIKRYMIPRYQSSIERKRNGLITNENETITPVYKNVNWGYFDDLAIQNEKIVSVKTVYSLLRENGKK